MPNCNEGVVFCVENVSFKSKERTDLVKKVYEAKRIYKEGALDICISLIKKGLIKLAEAAKQLRMSEVELQKHL